MDESTAVLDQDTSAVVADTSADTRSVDTTVQETPAVVEQPTPMDNNTTYDNLPQDDIKYDSSKDLTQNLIQDSMHISHDENVITNSGKAMNKFLTQDYKYNPEEAGSYWVAGAINDKDTQMQFLDTIIYEEMYDDMDLQRYYYDQTMATARAYAAQKDRETAYGFYRAAQQKAIAEAQLTGWYMPAEGAYLLANYTAAQGVLNDPDASPADKAKAKRITGVAEQWFVANKITTRGMKCLSMMNYEETVRHNKEMNRLQDQANKISAGANGINEALAGIKLREFKFQVEEMELQSGHDYSNEIGLDNQKYLGHNITDNEYRDYQALQGYGSVEELLSRPGAYADILTARGKEWVDRTLSDRLGEDAAKRFYKEYSLDQGKIGARTDVANGAEYLQEGSGTFNKLGLKDVKGHVLYTAPGEDGKVAVGYFENDVWIPITDKGLLVGEKKQTIDSVLTKKYGNDSVDYSGTNSISIDGEVYSYGRPATNTNAMSNTKLSENGWRRDFISNNSYGMDLDKLNDLINKAESSEGLKEKGKDTIQRNLTYCPELMDEKNFNEYIIFKDGHDNYYSLTDSGELHYLDDKSRVKEVGHATDLKNGMTIETDSAFGDTKYDRILKSSYLVSSYKKEDGNQYECRALPRSDGTVEYFEISHDWGNKYIVTNNDMTRQQVITAGGKPLTETKTELKTTDGNIKGYKTTIKDKESTNNVTISSTGANSSTRTVSSGSGNSSSDTKLQAEYKEYIRREERDHPNAELLSYEDWLKEYSSTINDVNTKEG